MTPDIGARIAEEGQIRRSGLRDQEQTFEMKPIISHHLLVHLIRSTEYYNTAAVVKITQIVREVWVSVRKILIPWRQGVAHHLPPAGNAQSLAAADVRRSKPAPGGRPFAIRGR